MNECRGRSFSFCFCFVIVVVGGVKAKAGIQDMHI